jgi:hypothetical protein
MVSEVGEMYEEMNDREIAVELDITEDEVQERRKDSGFLRLEEFLENKKPDDKVEVSVELDGMEKKKLQGFLGEKITSLMRSRVVKHLEKHLKDDWILRNKLNLVSEESTHQRYWASGRPRQGSIRIEGRSIKHNGSTEDVIREYVRERCVLAERDIFTKFRDVRNPFIDFNFYAVRKRGTEKVEFLVNDFSGDSFENGEKIEIEVPVIDDFKIVMLEVKTTKDDAKNLFSTNQRYARDLAKKSPFLEFFSLKINREFSELDIPETFSLDIRKHS